MKFKTLFLITAKYLLFFFILNFTAAFLYDYYTLGTSLAEFYGTFRFGYIFVIAAIVLAIYQTNKNKK